MASSILQDIDLDKHRIMVCHDCGNLWHGNYAESCPVCSPD